MRPGFKKKMLNCDLIKNYIYKNEQLENKRTNYTPLKNNKWNTTLK